MRVNRYSRVSPSQFNPLSMQEIFTVPLAKQKLHDQAQAQLDELGLFDINRLDADDDTAREYINEYKNRIDSQVDSIMNQGITHQTNRNIRKLLNDKNKWMSNDGVGGKIQSNYNAYQDYKSKLDKALEDGKLGNERYNALLNQATAKYEGVVNDGRLNLESVANRVDVAKKLKPYVKDVMSNPDSIESNTGFKYDPNSGMFINVKQGTTTTKEGLMEIIANNFAKTDPEIMNYLNQRERLGFEKSEDVISNIAKTFEGGYSVNEYRQDLTGKYPPEWMANNDKPDEPNNPSYEELPQQTYNLPVNQLSQSMGKMTDYYEGSTAYISPTTGISGGGTGYMVKVDDNKREEYYNSLPEQQRDIYSKIYESLKSRGKLPKNKNPKDLTLNQYVDKFSEEAVNAINKYLEKNKKYTQSTKLITNGQNSEYNGNAILSSKSLNEVSNAWYSQRSNRSYLIDGELKSWDQLDSKTQELLNDKDSKVNGYLSPKNFMRLNYNGSQNSDAMASMISIITPDGQQIMATRGRSEINSPAYKSDMKFNEIWSNTNSLPNIAYETNINGEKLNIVRITEDDKMYNKMANNAIQEYINDLVTNHNIDPEKAKEMALKSYYDNKGAIYSTISEGEDNPTFILEDHLLSALRGTQINN